MAIFLAANSSASLVAPLYTRFATSLPKIDPTIDLPIGINRSAKSNGAWIAPAKAAWARLISTGLLAFLCSSAWRSIFPPYCCIKEEPNIPAKAATGAASGSPAALTPAAARRAAVEDSAICGACSSSAPGICLMYSPTAGSNPFSLYLRLTASNPGCSPNVSPIDFWRSAAFSAA